MQYITGLTALNIPIPGRIFADWHTSGLFNRENWLWSGQHLLDTTHLLGDAGVYDATKSLRQYAPEAPQGTLAASYERAVFDLLYHFSKVGKPVPNVQYRDIDDAINAEQIRRWIKAVDLPESQKTVMLVWFQHCE